MLFKIKNKLKKDVNELIQVMQKSMLKIKSVQKGTNLLSKLYIIPKKYINVVIHIDIHK